MIVAFIFFDLDDTIYDRFVPFQAAYALFFQGERRDEAYDAYKACKNRSVEALAKVQSGRITPGEMHVHRYKLGLADIGISISAEEALRFSALYSREQEELKLTDTMRSILECCKNRFEKTGIITNGSAKHQREKIAGLGLGKWISPELIIISGEHNVLKPSPQIFALACLAAGTTPEKMIMVGDSYEVDVCGAAGFGMKTVWMNRNEEKDIPGSIIPDHVVHGEEELLEFVSKYCA